MLNSSHTAHSNSYHVSCSHSISYRLIFFVSCTDSFRCAPLRCSNGRGKVETKSFKFLLQFSKSMRPARQVESVQKKKREKLYFQSNFASTKHQFPTTYKVNQSVGTWMFCCSLPESPWGVPYNSILKRYILMTGFLILQRALNANQECQGMQEAYGFNGSTLHATLIGWSIYHLNLGYCYRLPEPHARICPTKNSCNWHLAQNTMNMLAISASGFSMPGLVSLCQILNLTIHKLQNLLKMLGHLWQFQDLRGFHSFHPQAGAQKIKKMILGHLLKQDPLEFIQLQSWIVRDVAKSARLTIFALVALQDIHTGPTAKIWMSDASSGRWPLWSHLGPLYRRDWRSWRHWRSWCRLWGPGPPTAFTAVGGTGRSGCRSGLPEMFQRIHMVLQFTLGIEV